MSPLFFILAGGALLALISRARVNSHAPLGTVTLYKGVPYRIVTRLETGSATASAMASVQSTVEKALASAGHSRPTFMTTDQPPIWAPAGATGWGRLLAVFDVVPQITDTAAIGQPLSNVGTIESMTRLDGRDFGAPPPGAAS